MPLKGPLAPLDVLNLLAAAGILLLAQLGLFSVSGSTGHELRNRARPFNLAMLAALVTGGGGGRMLASIVRSLCPERDPRT